MTADTLADISLAPAYPAHWRMARLGDVCDFVMGQSPSSETYNADGVGLPFLQGKAEFTDHYPSPVQYTTDPLKVADKGAVLISVRAPVGDVNVADQRYVIGRGLAAIKLRQGDNGFLFYLLRYQKARIASLGTGTTFQSINRATLDGLQIPLPPLAEQRAIAHVLRAAQEASAARRRQVTLERERKAALMQRLFTRGTRGEATRQTEIGEAPEGWQVVRLGDIAEVAYGLTVNKVRRKCATIAPYLTVANVTRGALRLDEVKEIGVLDGDAKRFRVQKGDVLLVEGNGNPKLLGSAAIWNDELPFVLHQNHLIRARPNQGVVCSSWITEYVNGDDGRAQLLGRSKTSSGLQSINSRVVSNLSIPLPPLTEQREIADILAACDAQIAALEREMALHEELFRALLEELMSGRLSALGLVGEADAAAMDVAGVE